MSQNIITNQNGFQVEVAYADSFIKRLQGLMFKKSLPYGQGLLLSPCSGVHTCFMKFAIDVVYLDKGYAVLGKETLKPWRVGKASKGTKMVLEVNEGESSLLQELDKLIICSNIK